MGSDKEDQIYKQQAVNRFSVPLPGLNFDESDTTPNIVILKVKSTTTDNYEFVVCIALFEISSFVGNC